MSEDTPYLYDPETQEEVKLIKTSFVGRADSNDVAIKDQSISSKHAKIVFKEDGYYVVDLNSFNSTYLNTEELTPEVPYKLEASDVLQFGDKILYWSSYDPNQKYLELPSMTGSYSVNESAGQEIVHTYDQPLDVVKPKKKTVSLKALRVHKEELEGMNTELEQLRELLADKDKFKNDIKIKEKELHEFDSYLEAKQYTQEKEVIQIINSVEDVNERIEKDKKDVWEKINVLRNQIEVLEEEINSLDEQSKKNVAMVTEMENDIEIIKGRTRLEKEIDQMKVNLQNLESSDHKIRIDELIYEIEAKEKAFKEAQKKYASSRFGKKAS